MSPYCINLMQLYSFFLFWKLACRNGLLDANCLTRNQLSYTILLFIRIRLRSNTHSGSPALFSLGQLSKGKGFYFGLWLRISKKNDVGHPYSSNDRSSYSCFHCICIRVHSRITRQQLPRDFSIDAQHELAVFLMEGVNMTHSSALCIRPAPHCATWIQPFEPCVRSSLYC